MVTTIRNWLYDTGRLSSTHFENVFTIGVGNLNVGGSGKTPMTEYLISKLSNKYNVAVLSRGYKRKTKGFLIGKENTDVRAIGDEPKQYLIKFPHITVAVCEDRVNGIKQLLQNRPKTEVIILDDCFQHRKLRTDFQILLTPYITPFYKNFLLPLGNLRESRKEAKRADYLIVSKCPKDTDVNKVLKDKPLIERYYTGPLAISRVKSGQPYYLRNNEPAELPSKVTLVSGIVYSEGLEQHVQKHSHIKKRYKFKDHYEFKEKDIWQFNRVNVPIVTTEKDATKLYNFLDQLIVSVIVVPISVSFLYNEENFLKVLDKDLSKKIAGNVEN